MIFMAPEVGNRSLEGHLRMILDARRGELPVRLLVLLADNLPPVAVTKCQTYNDYMASIEGGFVSDSVLSRAESRVTPSDVVNFSFTSGEAIFLVLSMNREVLTSKRYNWTLKSSRPDQ